MELALKLAALPREKEERETWDGVLEEIREVTRQLACNEAWFCQETDEDLIDACIFENCALWARYRFLLRQARQKNLQASPF
ncbi:MAG TPA: DUF2508 family protein [Firmicutes bacterium]|nr:DUF2508 family protein [Bacillota bacterium]